MMVSKGNKVKQVHPVNLVSRAHLVHLVSRVVGDHQAHPAHLEAVDHLVNQDQ
jgi:anthranilate/para-aminobenzoate synthase component I